MCAMGEVVGVTTDGQSCARFVKRFRPRAVGASFRPYSLAEDSLRKFELPTTDNTAMDIIDWVPTGLQLLCPIGCQRDLTSTEADACVLCPEQFTEACGNYGGCDPAGGATNETDASDNCVCQDGMEGRKCQYKQFYTLRGMGTVIIMTIVLLVVALISWRVWLLTFFKFGFGPCGEYPTIEYSVPGLVLDIEVILLLVTFSQLGAAAFNIKIIPWTWDSWIPTFFTALSFDWTMQFPDVGLGWRLIVVVLLSIMYVVLNTFLRYSKVTIWINQHIMPLILIPSIRVTAGIMLGCTYFGGREEWWHDEFGLNMLDDDNNLRCWDPVDNDDAQKSYLHEVYVVVGALNLVVILFYIGSNVWGSTISGRGPGKLASRRPNSTPIPSFVPIFTIAKVLTTLVDVGVGQFHPKTSCLFSIGWQIALAALTVLMRPFYHTYLNRFFVYGCFHTIIAYVSAYIAITVDDPQSETSAQVFIWTAVINTMCFIGMEVFMGITEGKKQVPPVCFLIAKAWDEVFDAQTKQQTIEERDGEKITIDPYIFGAFAGFPKYASVHYTFLVSEWLVQYAHYLTCLTSFRDYYNDSVRIVTKEEEQSDLVAKEDGYGEEADGYEETDNPVVMTESLTT
eukprot:SAG11_NODE_2453_length_3345_cov_2.597659_1_plen_623_part_00